MPPKSQQSEKPPVTNKWLDKVQSFVAPETQAEKHTIGTHEVLFYPISVSMLFQLKPIAKPLLAALSDLFTAHEKLVGLTQRDMRDKDGSGLVETIETAMSPEMAEYAADRQRRAVEELVEKLLDEKNKLVLANLIIDSARDFFEGETIDIATRQEFINGLDLPVAVEFVIGIAKANKKVFNPFMTALPKNVQKRVRDLAVSEKPANPSSGDTKPQS